MRSDIHPEYREVLFHDTNADAYFVIGSTMNSSQTKEYQGKTYPYVTLDISSASHLSIRVSNVRPAMKVVWQALTNVLAALNVVKIENSRLF